MSEKVISLPLTFNPTFEHQTPDSIRSAVAKHTPPSKKPGYVSRWTLGSSSTLSVDQPNVEPLTVVNRDIQYYAEVEIGSNEQRFRLDFDTGSSDLWVPDSTCKTRNVTFNRAKSTTFKPAKGRFGIRYGDGSQVRGILGQDRVNVAGMVIENQTFGLATVESTSFSHDVVDGILGMAYNTICSVPGTPTVMDNLISQKLIESPMFSVWLGRSIEGGGGEYRFGGYDPERFEGELTWVPVTEKKYWQVKCEGLFVGDVDLQMKGDVIIDTDVSTAIHGQIPGAINDGPNGWILPNTPEVAAMSGIQFVLNGVKFDVVMKDMMREEVDGKKGYVYSGIASAGTICVFDLGTNRVGIAKCKPPPRISPSVLQQMKEEIGHNKRTRGCQCSIMMAIQDFDYSSDSSLPEEFKNTNHINSLRSEYSYSDSDNDVDNGNNSISNIPGEYADDHKDCLRRRAQMGQKSRAKATQSYIQKKIKKIEEKDRVERKQEQKKNNAKGRGDVEGSASENDSIVDKMGDANISTEHKSSNETMELTESESDNEQESTLHSWRRSRAKDASKKERRNNKNSKSQSRVELSNNGNQPKEYDVINRSNKRADRHRKPEDEILEPIVTPSSNSINHEPQEAEEEEEKIEFQHNDGDMKAKPLTSRDWKQIFKEKLQERDQAREKEKNENKIQ
ncbi:hypothetical protein BGZ76_008618 [Entomortierella beljakovae]|nr:hypothetical protein BGZ76_008618 [Entomortierella beljakovae]